MKIHLIQMKIDELLAVCDEHNNDPGELINICLLYTSDAADEL